MLAAIIFAIIVVVVIPVVFLMSMSLVAGIMGSLLRQNAERANEDSELIDTNY
jgi:predicted membrane metal-binding protein